MSKFALPIRVGLCTVLLASMALAAAASEPRFSEEYEKRVGQEAAHQVDDEYKRYEDSDALARITAMVAEIAAASTRPTVQYDVRLIDTDKVNAFSLPGGIIYVTKGLLDAVQSDDELAGVLAHEIAHNCTYDALVQADRNKELFTGSVAAAIAAILLGGNSNTVSTVLAAGEYVRQGVLGGYSVDMERAADEHAVDFMLHTHYNPVGLLTFMGRLAAEWRREPQVDPGVYRTHPDPTARVDDLADKLYRAGVDVNPRATTKWERPKAEEVELDGKPVVHVVLWGDEIFRVLVPGPDADTPMARAEGIVQRLTASLEAGMRSYQLQIGDNGVSPTIGARHQVIVTIYPEDAQAYGLDPAALANQVKTALRRALFKERLDRLY